MLSAFARAFKTPDLRKKILFTLAIMAIYRFGTHVPSPGIDYELVQRCQQTATAAGSVLGMANLFSGGAMMQLSSDHTLVGEMLARGQITSHEAMVHPHRHYITRALGTAPSVAPDILRLNYRPDDVWLLCSDGLSNYVRSHEMADLLSRPTSWEARVESLIELALKRGGSDNITALVVASEEVGV